MTLTKLYLIFYMFGKIGANVGPLPYDMEECQRRAADMNTSMDRVYEDPDKVAKLREQHPGVQRSDVNFQCEHRMWRPRNDSSFGRDVLPQE